MRKAPGIGAVAIATAALAVPAFAAVKPQSGHYRQAQPKDPNADVVSFELKGTKLYSFSHYDSCVIFQMTGRFVTKVKKGKFEFHKTLNADGGTRYKIDLTGHFTSATKAKGQITYKLVKGNASTKKGCHTTTKFNVAKDGPARPPNFADR
jgi:hypothetical protein